jgi:hypothetical protein
MGTLSKATLSLAAGAALIALAALRAEGKRPAPPEDCSAAAEEMARAASALWASLTPEQQAKASFALRDDERKNFHFFPIARKGLPWKELTGAQQPLAYALLRSGLSADGFVKATTIMSLGQLLRDMEPNKPNPHRDSDAYAVTIFGTPGSKEPWGWRVEGFHLSVNFTIVDGAKVSASPSFFGTYPNVVKSGPRKGLLTLADEEGLALQLIRSLDPEQRRLAVFSERTPVEIKGPKEITGGLLTGNLPKVKPLEPAGLPAARLSPNQAELLRALVREYAHHHRPELAARDLGKIEAAGWDKVHFAWAGRFVKGEPHYYRVQGPTFLIEYDNTGLPDEKEPALHIHSVWRDFDGDFGEDLLGKHLREQHGR